MNKPLGLGVQGPVTMRALKKVVVYLFGVSNQFHVLPFIHLNSRCGQKTLAACHAFMFSQSLPVVQRFFFFTLTKKKICS